MDATVDSSQPSAISCATSAKSLEQPPNPSALAVEPSLLVQLHEMDTWRTISANARARRAALEQNDFLDFRARNIFSIGYLTASFFSVRRPSRCLSALKIPRLVIDDTLSNGGFSGQLPCIFGVILCTKLPRGFTGIRFLHAFIAVVPSI